MTQTFKVGDKVQRQPGGNWSLPSGKTFTVQSVGYYQRQQYNVQKGDPFIVVDFPSTFDYEYPANMFTLVQSVEPTDATLAATYRAAVVDTTNLLEQLKARGYTVESKAVDGLWVAHSKVNPWTTELRISKSETKRVEL